MHTLHASSGDPSGRSDEHTLLHNVPGEPKSARELVYGRKEGSSGDSRTSTAIQSTAESSRSPTSRWLPEFRSNRRIPTSNGSSSVRRSPEAMLDAMSAAGTSRGQSPLPRTESGQQTPGDHEGPEAKGEEVISLISMPNAVPTTTIVLGSIPSGSAKLFDTADRRLRALVVDDAKGNRTMVQRILTRLGYEVETAEDGFDALIFMGVPLEPELLSTVKLPPAVSMGIPSRCTMSLPPMLRLAYACRNKTYSRKQKCMCLPLLMLYSSTLKCHSSMAL